MHAISLKCATSNASTSVSVYLIAEHLTVCSYLKPPDTMIVLLSLAPILYGSPLIDYYPAISIKCDVTPIKMLFTLKYTFYKKVSGKSPKCATT